MPGTELAGLKKQRASNKRRMTQIVNFVDQCNNKTPTEELRTRLMRAEKLMTEFTAIESLIFNVNPDEESDYQYEESYYKAITGLNTWIRSNSSTLGMSTGLDSSMNVTHTGGQIEVRLPKINIPIFSGEYTQWPSFYDLYSSTIHESMSLNPVQKFQYLKGLLRGEAEQLLRHISVTEANYMGALNKLKERYSRKRPILYTFIRTFIEQPVVHTPNATNIKKLMDTSDEVIRGLKALGDSAETRDPWLIYLLLNKLDDKSKTQWAETTTEIDNPTFPDFLKFLARRIDALESVTSSIKRSNPKPTVSGHVATNHQTFTCALCKNEHSLFQCPDFNSMDANKRREWVKTNYRCFNCLSLKHPVFKCTSQRRCQHCKRKHHSLLHIDEQVEESIEKSTINTEAGANCYQSLMQGEQISESMHPDADETTCSAVCSSSSPSQTILPTAIINVVNSYGHAKHLRALLDSGSQVSFITEACTQNLNLKRQNARLSVCGLGDSKGGCTKGVVTVTVRIANGTEFSLKAFILPRITTKLPIQSINQIHIAANRETKLADPNFHISSNIDMLIGADYFFELLEEGQIKLNNHGLILQKTVFGWVASGRPKIPINSEAVSMIATTNGNSIVDIDYTLRRFWEIESIARSTKLLSPEEQFCEDSFKRHLQHTKDGRFIVSLPFKKSPSSLGYSMSSAVQRLRSMERRFVRDSEFKNLYHKFMLEYQELTHMEEIPQNEVNNSGFYLPHHGVLRNSSSTTKLRVVFDGSAKSSSGISLNDCLAVGPTIQSTLYAILLRFREHNIVFSADVEKMYRQVLVSKGDTQYQKIVWRTSPTEPIRHYRLLTVTYGLASAPFLATRALNQIAENNRRKSPLAANIIRRDIYVDDLMSGADTEEEAIPLQHEITSLLNKHGFMLRKWSSNATAVLERIHGDDKTHDPKEIDDNTEESSKSVKVLGMTWNPSTDEFTFSSDIQGNPVLTKRTVLSQASRLFDPLGWLAPIIVSVKIFIQQLWAANLEWDDTLPERRAKEWLSIFEQMKQVSQIRIPRSISINKNSIIQIHGFCDASQYAYAAAVFVRIESINGEVSCKLITAKTKVAPIKQTTLPRLELCGAVLLTNLLNLVKTETQMKISEVYCWTDSTIVLDWLASHPRRWNTFVGNRTAEILNSWSRKHWRHVSSSDNSADCASRGLSPLDLKTHTLWWNGPDWLVQPADNWPIQQTDYGQIEEERNQLFSFTNTVHNSWIDDLFARYSSLRKLQKVLCYICRFIANVQKRKGTRTSGVYLSRDEMFDAVNRIYKNDQAKYYPNEVKSLITKENLARTSPLKSLSPFIDDCGIIRVGGRLENSLTPFSIKHPVILHAKSSITALLLEEIHIDNKHAGPSLTLSIVRQQVWIPGCKTKVKQVIKKCVICTKFKAQMQTQLMGNLPRCRVELIRPFLKVGVDYAGPILIHLVKGRGQKTYKAYICLFVCLGTKAIHLELVTDMTSEAFIGGLKRFIARRGICTDIYSDNGTNFVGADNQLTAEFSKLIKNSNNISDYSFRQRITWHFIPPSAPHFGGIWEAGVKSTKYHLKRVIGKSVLTIEEMYTLLAEVEATLNSRPICSLHSSDIDVLTPSHFLIGHAANKIPEIDITHLKPTHLSRWQMIQQTSQHFWKRWYLEYLTSLQARQKWKENQDSVKVNDIVVIKDGNLPPNQWLLGKILQTHPGSDGIVRVVTLKTKSGEIKRPIHKLCILPVANDDLTTSSPHIEPIGSTGPAC